MSRSYLSPDYCQPTVDFAPESPCLNCPDRKQACHASCKNYISWKEELEETRKMLSRERLYYSIKKRHVNNAFVAKAHRKLSKNVYRRNRDFYNDQRKDNRNG